MGKTIEQLTAETVLQIGDKIKVGRRVVRVRKPTQATLIMASAAISKLPRVQLNEDEQFVEVMRVAKDCQPEGEAVAIYLVSPHGALKKGLWHWLWERRVQRLSATIQERMTPSEIHDLAIQLFKTSEVQHFFDLTTFLTGINMLKPTVKVEETTASGQQ